MSWLKTSCCGQTKLTITFLFISFSISIHTLQYKYMLEICIWWYVHIHIHIWYEYLCVYVSAISGCYRVALLLYALFFHIVIVVYLIQGWMMEKNWIMSWWKNFTTPKTLLEDVFNFFFLMEFHTHLDYGKWQRTLPSLNYMILNANKNKLIYYHWIYYRNRIDG